MATTDPRVEATLDLLLDTSDAFVRAATALLETRVLSATERDVVMHARKVVRIASSQREEGRAISARNARRRQRHSARAASIIAAANANDDATFMELVGIEPKAEPVKAEPVAPRADLSGLTDEQKAEQRNERRRLRRAERRQKQVSR